MKLEFEAFKAWVGSHLDSEVIGKRRSAFTCPLANFLKQDLSAFDEKIVVGIARYGTDTKSVELPAWAFAFRREIDFAGVAQSDVTAKAALKILREIPAGATVAR